MPEDLSSRGECNPPVLTEQNFPLQNCGHHQETRSSRHDGKWTRLFVAQATRSLTSRVRPHPEDKRRGCPPFPRRRWQWTSSGCIARGWKIWKDTAGKTERKTDRRTDVTSRHRELFKGHLSWYGTPGYDFCMQSPRVPPRGGL